MGGRLGVVATAALTATVFAQMVWAPERASACGGCFGPAGQPSVVTAHRMAVSLSVQETILWDQFEYSGAPEDFVWVLPVTDGAGARVEVADNAFFLALTQQTAITLRGPFRSTGSGPAIGCGASAAGSAEGPESDPVQVFHEGTVGPYATATIGSDDPMALIAWLQERSYAVPDAMLPTIAHYVDLGMSFVALRLAPGEGIRRMDPVRVTTPGLNVSFPLRMVAAGVAEEVSLELFVIGEGRYEVANFPNGEINRDAVVYDWATQRYNYDALADKVLGANGRRTWLTEFASEVYTDSVAEFRDVDDEGTAHFAIDDWRAAVGDAPSATVTRMRAVLPVSALGEDLVLQASARPELTGFVWVQREVNEDTAAASGALRGERSGRAVIAPMAIGLAALGLALRRVRG